ncbi:MAG TPA: sigma-70 family RNA polymerase sigma factor [Gemmataceae bacterium]|nr:sigma-70 family RNA polymerase sigma factor [Gemmataceae bacterium]
MTGDAFEALLGPNLPSVRRFVRMRLGTCDQADDVIQQTLLQAFVHRDQLRAESKFKSWIRSIAMNEVRMFFRTGRPSVSLDELRPIDSGDSRNSPLADAEQLERLEWLRAGMEKLCDRDRETIRLRDLEGMSITEMADAFELSKAAAKSIHFRARRRLACALRSMGRRLPARELQAAKRGVNGSAGQGGRLTSSKLRGGQQSIGRAAIATVPGQCANGGHA